MFGVRVGDPERRLVTRPDPSAPFCTGFEPAMSSLTLAIGLIERFPPQTADDIHRLRLAVSRIDTATTKAARAIELESENV